LSSKVLMVLAVLLSATVVCAQEAAELSDMADMADMANKANKTEQAEQVSGPIVITSDTLRADGANGTATFSGSVVATGNDLLMKADSMKVFYAADGGALERIEAWGSVKLVREGRIVTSERAVYRSSGRTMTFTGNARVVEGGNILVGSKIVYMLDDDRYEVEDSKVFIESMAGQGGQDGQK